MVIGALIMLLNSAFMLLAAFFPKWQLRWCGRHGWWRKDLPLISIAGRLALSAFFGYVAITLILRGDGDNYVELVAIFFGAIIYTPVFLIYLRDSRRFKESQQQYMNAPEDISGRHD
ncbi:MAG: hypothetical protein WCI73_08300 [Phycisphaerae bacterium]